MYNVLVPSRLNSLCFLQQSHSTQADGDGDKAKVLLERLKMLEAEKSALVLENEAQRQQYDRCLDQIANQVVQALMSQKVRVIGQCQY